MRYQVTLREANQHFAQYVKEIEAGNEVVITRHGKAVALLCPISEQNKLLSAAQIKARAKVIAMMQEGLSLKGESFDRDQLHDE
jgi:prevent-host-death family protein